VAAAIRPEAPWKESGWIVLFDDIEVLDFCGPFEVFCAVRLNEEKHVRAVALRGDSGGRKERHGRHPRRYEGHPEHSFNTCPHWTFWWFRRLGTRRELNNPVMLDWLRRRAAEVET